MREFSTESFPLDELTANLSTLHFSYSPQLASVVELHGDIEQVLGTEERGLGRDSSLFLRYTDSTERFYLIHELERALESSVHYCVTYQWRPPNQESKILFCYGARESGLFQGAIVDLSPVLRKSNHQLRFLSERTSTILKKCCHTTLQRLTHHQTESKKDAFSLRQFIRELGALSENDPSTHIEYVLAESFTALCIGKQFHSSDITIGHVWRPPPVEYESFSRLTEGLVKTINGNSSISVAITPSPELLIQINGLRSETLSATQLNSLAVSAGYYAVPGSGQITIHAIK